MKPFLLFVIVSCSLGYCPLLSAQEVFPAPTPVLAPEADSATATRAWLETVPAEKREKSDAYFEGTYWLILWNFLLASAISLLLLGTGLSARMRDFAERTTRFKALQVVLYGLPYLLLVAVLSFPLLVYQKFFREHAYDLATQTFPAWFREQMIGLGVEAVLFSILLIVHYAVFRRAPKTWWLWGAGVVVILLALAIMISPIYIEPLFNKYKPLEDPAITES
ncbi:MAG: hypothetical protein ACXW32_14735, partial [Limisphaerales bacterium]